MLAVRGRSSGGGRRDRRRRLTIATGSLGRGPVGSSEGRASPGGSRFELLAEGAAWESSEEDDSEVPLAAAMEVLDSPRAPEWSTVVRRGRRSDEELAQDFWSDIGYPTPASRFWEKQSPSEAGTNSCGSFLCRSQEMETLSVAEKNGLASKASMVAGGPSQGPPSPMGFAVGRRLRAGVWRGPVPRRSTPPPVIANFF
jgi:hypothetical protein